MAATVTPQLDPGSPVDTLRGHVGDRIVDKLIEAQLTTVGDVQRATDARLITLFGQVRTVVNLRVALAIGRPTPTPPRKRRTAAQRLAELDERQLALAEKQLACAEEEIELRAELLRLQTAQAHRDALLAREAWSIDEFAEVLGVDAATIHKTRQEDITGQRGWLQLADGVNVTCFKWAGNGHWRVYRNAYQQALAKATRAVAQ